MKYHMPVAEKLACPDGNDLKPSCSRSVRVQAVQDVKPCTGLDVRSCGRSHRPNRSGRGRPTVICAWINLWPRKGLKIVRD